jgi:hypothetical protein
VRAACVHGWLVTATLLGVAGCGPQGPARYRVHGTVSHAGRPVPLGRIVFEPDVLEGNRGPQGFAVIENGRFDTAVNHGRGTSGGAMVVTIDGFEPAGSGPAASPARSLFKGHQEHRDFPTAAVEMNFDVRAAGGR